MDRALLAAHVAGDPEAFRRLAERHRDRLWSIAYRTLGDHAEAEDAVQEALLKAHVNAERFRGDSAVSTWLYRIVTNACIDLARRRRRLRVVGEDDLQRAAEDLDEAAGHPQSASVAALDVRRALAELPVEQRLAVYWTDIHGLSTEDAADLLGIPVGTLKSRNSRGKAAMRRFLSP